MFRKSVDVVDLVGDMKCFGDVLISIICCVEECCVGS